MNHKQAMKRTVLLGLLVLPVALATVHAENEANGKNPSGITTLAVPAAPNRTLPKMDPAGRALEFPANPTPQHFFRARIFEEPLVPIGGEPSQAENAALAAALLGYSQRTGPDDFSSLTGFLREHPQSPWCAALWTDLGLEYFNSGRYSLALDAWRKAWPLAREAVDLKGKAVGDRAVGELAYMYARLGRMAELNALLQSIEGRVLLGAATERISGARAGLWEMQNRPEVSFRCGPLALHRIILSLDPQHAGSKLIMDSASTTNGVSLAQVADLSKKLGLNYQMAFREKGAAFVVPSVVHWKVGHYAALIRQDGDRYLLQDPTFRNDAWVTKAALEDECSGYFVIPPESLDSGWRAVASGEGNTIWGKGNVGGPDPGGGPPGPPDPPPPPCKGMAVSSVDLLFVSLSLLDEPVGYSPPVGPSVRCVIRYNQRDSFQPANFTYSNFGSKWTFDWLAYIKDNPTNTLADVEYYQMGGFVRFFTGFDQLTQTFRLQRLDLTKLTRTSPTIYEMLAADGSKRIFSQSDGSAGTARKIFLTQILDPFGNAISFTYDANLRLVAVTDAIGQVTTLSYSNTNDLYKITKVTDPFGRFATFDYDSSNRLSQITDVIGLTSRFTYEGASDFINSLITPYGTNTFIKGETGTTRWLETHFPDGNRERVEFNQSPATGVAAVESVSAVPTGMATYNDFLQYRNTFFWSKTACAGGYGDYTKAKVYHWVHSTDINAAARVLESEKEPLEGRVWYDYAGQNNSLFVGNISRPSHVGRVLDDGSTQLYSYEYNSFGNLTNQVDPVGRTFSYVYASNGIDLLEARQTRAGNNELLSKRTYNAQHLPLTKRDAAGQVTTYTYNPRGQLLTETDPIGTTTSYLYNSNGYLMAIDGPLPGSSDTETFTYDSHGRIRTGTDVSGHTVTYDYDALDRVTKTTYPDGTFDQFTYERLDQTARLDRAGRLTTFGYNSVRELAQQTDPLNRVTRFEWCKCGQVKSLTDPMGRTTTWRNDVQGRVSAKVYPDGTEVNFLYENSTSRLRQRIDEKLQVTQYSYNRDDTLSERSYANTAVATPSVTYTYDPDYERETSMTDGTGTTRYHYVRITGSPALGAGELAAVDGPLPNDTIAFGYDQLGRRVFTAIDGIASATAFDAAGRVLSITNALGTFLYTYDGNSFRTTSQSYPNGQTVAFTYAGNLLDQHLQKITHRRGVTPISESIYGRDVRGQITSWSQQSGAQAPAQYSFGYDVADQLTSAQSNAVPAFAYTYDSAGNRLREELGATTNIATYNALNQLTTVTGNGTQVTNEWDGEQRLAAVNAGNQRTEFTYDGLGRRVAIRLLVNGSEISHRRFLWCDEMICEERDANGVVSKRFFDQGVTAETGAATGAYFYTSDHLGSIREMTDSGGSIRARYSYDPFGRRTRVSGDLETDFGFAGMFWSTEAGLSLTLHRAYDPGIGRWLSRDPLENAELEEGSNLYSYVQNDPVNHSDPLGLERWFCCQPELEWLNHVVDNFRIACRNNPRPNLTICLAHRQDIKRALKEVNECQDKPCPQPPPMPEPKPPKPQPPKDPKPKCPGPKRNSA